jgi:hypothetical protein
MGNVATPTDPNGARLGYIVHPSASVAYMWHAVGTASGGTILTNDTRHAGVATHQHDEAMGSVSPIVAVGLRAGSHVPVGTGDAMAWQGDLATGAAYVQVLSGTVSATGVTAVGTVTLVNVGTAATRLDTSALASRRRVRIQAPGSADIYYGHDSGMGTATRSLLIEQGNQDELDAGTAIGFWAATPSGTVTVRFAEYA